MKLSTVDAFKHLQAADCFVEIKGENMFRLQKVLLGMLEDIVGICNRYGIEYTLGGGACLGAVRHAGFIPWDDDIDFNIARKDVNRMLDILRRDREDRYWVHDVNGTENYELDLIKVRLKGTVLKTRDDVKNGEEAGVPFEIFIIENVPDNAILRYLHGFGSMALGFIYSCVRFAENGESYLSLAKGNSEASRAFRVKIAIGRLFSFRSASRWCRTWDAWNSLCRDEGSRYVSIPAGRKHYFGELYLRSDYFPASEGEFEGMRVSLPARPEVYLTALYGPDYMVPPPPEGREAHLCLEFDLGGYGPEGDDGEGGGE